MNVAADIDAIVAWVDGADPAHRARCAEWSGEAHAGATDQARFVESGEIYLCLASILKFAPYIRRIHLVTDAQRPALLGAFEEVAGPGRIAPVDHDAIFAGTEAAQPTFNIRSIEAVLDRIPGLAAQAAYFNDDMLLTAPTTPETFFRNGLPVLHGVRTVPDARRPRKRLEAALRALLRRPDRRPGHGLAQERAAALAGETGAYLRAPHAPHPIRRETLAAFARARPEVLARQLSFRFRDRAQYNPIALANHLELTAVNSEAGPLDIAYMRPGSEAQIDAALHRIRAAEVWAACLQSLERMTPAARHAIVAALSERLSSHLPAQAAAHLARLHPRP